MKKLTFSNGDEMPILGLGTWKSEPGQVYEAVKTAIELGYRHIDCAAIYGNEKEIGQALQDVIASGLVQRSDLWITSKLWNSAHRFEKVEEALHQTLLDLQLDYLDLYLIHWPVVLKESVVYPKTADDFLPLTEMPLTDTWRAMLAMKDLGIIKHAGVSNFNKPKIENLISVTGRLPEMNQVEMHPYLQQPELVSYCHDKNIHMTAYSPLGSNDRPSRYKDLGPVLLEDEVVVNIAKSKGVTPAQILIAFAIHRNISVIPKSVNPKRLAENLQAAQVQLTAAEMEQLKKLDTGTRYIDGSIWTIEGSPYTKEELWNGSN